MHTHIRAEGWRCDVRRYEYIRAAASGLSRLTVMTISFLAASTCAECHTPSTHEGIGK